MRRWTILVPLFVVATSLQLPAAVTVTLDPGEWLTVKPVGGVLSITSTAPKLIKVQCSAGYAELEEPGEAIPMDNETVTLKPTGILWCWRTPAT